MGAAHMAAEGLGQGCVGWGGRGPLLVSQRISCAENSTPIYLFVEKNNSMVVIHVGHGLW
jgi:hypothetical protein